MPAAQRETKKALSAMAFVSFELVKPLACCVQGFNVEYQVTGGSHEDTGPRYSGADRMRRASPAQVVSPARTQRRSHCTVE